MWFWPDGNAKGREASDVLKFFFLSDPATLKRCRWPVLETFGSISPVRELMKSDPIAPACVGCVVDETLTGAQYPRACKTISLSIVNTCVESDVTQ